MHDGDQRGSVTTLTLARRTVITGSAALVGLGAVALGSASPALAAMTVQYRLPFPQNKTSSPYGGTRNHRGHDFSPGGGTNIPCAADGIVRMNEWNSALGWVLVVAHNDAHYTGYCHMANRSPNWGNVKMSQIIGQVGATGSSTAGAHLHFTMATKVRGCIGETGHMDPLPYILQRLAPVTRGPREDDQEMAQYYRNQATGQIGRFAGGVTVFGNLNTYTKHRYVVGLWNTQNPAFKIPVPPDPSSAANFVNLDDDGWNVQISVHGGIVDS